MIVRSGAADGWDPLANHLDFRGWSLLTVASGGTMGAVARQQSVCCHSLVAALIIAFGLAGSTGW